MDGFAPSVDRVALCWTIARSRGRGLIMARADFADD